MFIPTSFAQEIASQRTDDFRGAATHRLNLPNPLAAFSRARLARRPAAARPCVAC